MEEKAKELTNMLFFRGKKYYVTLNDREVRLAKYALFHFRNKLIAQGKPADDVNDLLIRILG